MSEGTYEIPVTPEPEEWQTCFIIGINKGGEAFAHNDVEGFLKDKEFTRLATGQDMWTGAAQVKRTIEEINQTQRFVNAQLQIAQAIQQQTETQRVVQGLKLPGSPNF